MELYTKTSALISKILMQNYSTSFGWSALLFPGSVRQHIYNIYGLVRIADEIVDTYIGKDKSEKLSNLKKETLEAIKTGYSSNPIVHSFAQTYREFKINPGYIKAFFLSMSMDTKTINYTEAQYKKYIYGSAEVIGLMCLAVYCNDNNNLFKKLSPGAQALGAAYQKINFLRDLGSDSQNLSRVYFPNLDINNIADFNKENIIRDIYRDLAIADKAIPKIPKPCYKPTLLSRLYYGKLITKLSTQTISQILNSRCRINNFVKLWLLFKVVVGIK